MLWLGVFSRRSGITHSLYRQQSRLWWTVRLKAWPQVSIVTSPEQLQRATSVWTETYVLYGAYEIDQRSSHQQEVVSSFSELLSLTLWLIDMNTRRLCLLPAVWSQHIMQQEHWQLLARLSNWTRPAYAVLQQEPARTVLLVQSSCSMLPR